MNDNPAQSDPVTRDDETTGPSRRLVMKAGLVGAAAVGLVSVGLTTAEATTKQHRAPKPRKMACTPGTVTDSNIEGPYFEAGSPERNDITSGVTGVLLTLTGSVSDDQCQPVASGLLDFWQCDSNGVYDNSGYTLRGHQYTDTSGAYSLSTIVPSYYTQDGATRTPHIHVKVQAPNGPILTTQLFFPDDTQAYGLDFASLNAQDAYFDAQCYITLQQTGDGNYNGSFDFVITTA